MRAVFGLVNIEFARLKTRSRAPHLCMFPHHKSARRAKCMTRTITAFEANQLLRAFILSHILRSTFAYYHPLGKKHRSLARIESTASKLRCSLN